MLAQQKKSHDQNSIQCIARQKKTLSHFSVFQFGLFSSALRFRSWSLFSLRCNAIRPREEKEKKPDRKKSIFLQGTESCATKIESFLYCIRCLKMNGPRKCVLHFCAATLSYTWIFFSLIRLYHFLVIFRERPSREKDFLELDFSCISPLFCMQPQLLTLSFSLSLRGILV